MTRDDVTSAGPHGLGAADWYEMIDDFIPVASMMHVVLIPRRARGTSLHINTQAAVAATGGRLSSLAYAKRAYVDESQITENHRPTAPDLLREVYASCLQHMDKAMNQLQANGPRPPTLGEFAGSVALERLRPSFKSAHLLYRIGHWIDADTVARLILEQIAWASAIPRIDAEDELRSIRSSRAVTGLSRLWPQAGRLYGELSEAAHLNLRQHHRFVGHLDHRTTITVRELALEHAVSVLLALSDMFVIVWEATQAPFLNGQFTAGSWFDDTYRVDSRRPFLQVIASHRAAAATHARDSSSG